MTIFTSFRNLSYTFMCSYANLNDLSFLSVPGYIAGVTNPMFKSKPEWWDVLCDITTSEVFTSWPNERDEFEVVDKTFLQDVRL